MIGENYSAVCEELVKHQLEMLDWFGSQQYCKNINISNKVDHYRKESEQIQKKLANCNDEQDNLIDSLVNEWSSLWQWKENCMDDQYVDYKTENQKLQEKNDQYKADLHRNRSMTQDLEKKWQEAENAITNLRKQLLVSLAKLRFAKRVT